MQENTVMEECRNKAAWDSAVLGLGGHPLQLWGWGETKALHRWKVQRWLVMDGGQVIGAAQLLLRPLPWPLKSLVYIPRGPAAAAGREAEVLTAVAGHVKKARLGVALTVEPHWREWPALPGWKRSENTILIPRTLILDLGRSEEELQADMPKKTRQYIRKSAKDGVEFRLIEDRELDDALAIYHQTAERAGFPIHSDGYYRDVHRTLGEHSPVYGAFHEGTMVAFLWLASSGRVAFELYGGVTDQGQHLRANYGLKWHAIAAMKEQGLSEYDMNGLLNDGVSTFKQKFANHEDLLVGTYDHPLSPLYPVWDKGLPLVRKALRALKSGLRRGGSGTSQTGEAAE